MQVPPPRDRISSIVGIGNMLIMALGILRSATGTMYDVQAAQGVQGADDPRAVLPLVGWAMFLLWLALIGAVLLLERGKDYPVGRRVVLAAVTVLLWPLLALMIGPHLHGGFLPQLALPMCAAPADPMREAVCNWAQGSADPVSAP